MQICQEGKGAQVDTFLTQRTRAPHMDAVMAA